MSAFVEKKTGLEGNRTLIQSGFLAWCNVGSIFEQDISEAKLPLEHGKATWGRKFSSKPLRGGQLQVSERLQGVGTQESGVAGVAEYASKVFIRKSRTSISLGKSSPSSQIL